MNKNIKVTIGVCVFVIIMALISIIVVIAMRAAELRSELYNVELNYVDNCMYDGVTIAVEDGKYVLVKNGAVISERYSYLEYEMKDYFSYIDDRGRMGFVNTAGKNLRTFDSKNVPISIDPDADYYGKIVDGEYHFVYEGGQEKADGAIIPYSKLSDYSIGRDISLYLGGKTYFYESGDNLYFKAVGGTAVLITPDAGSKRVTAIDERYMQIKVGGQFRTVDLVNGGRVSAIDGYEYRGNESVTANAYDVVADRLVIYNYASPTMTVKIPEYNDEYSVPAGEIVLAFSDSALLTRVSSDSAKLYKTGETKEGELSVLFDGLNCFGSGSSYTVYDETLEEKLTTSTKCMSVHLTKTDYFGGIEFEGLESYIYDGNKLYAYAGGNVTEKLTGVRSFGNVYLEHRYFPEGVIVAGNAVYDARLKKLLEAPANADEDSLDLMMYGYLAYSYAVGGKIYYATPKAKQIDIEGDVMAVEAGDGFIFLAEKDTSDGKVSDIYSPSGKKILTLPCAAINIVNIYAVDGTCLVWLDTGEIYSSAAKEPLEKTYDIYEISHDQKFIIGLGVKTMTVYNIRDFRADTHYSGFGFTYESGEFADVFTDLFTGLKGIMKNGKITCPAKYREITVYNKYAVVSMDGVNYSMIAHDGTLKSDGMFTDFYAFNDYAIMYDYNNIGTMFSDNGKVVLSGIIGQPTEIIQLVYAEKYGIMGFPPQERLQNRYYVISTGTTQRIFRNGGLIENQI